MTKNRSTVIVGGGIIGAMSAWYLNQAGRQVTIIDQGEFGAACSHANCGYISPSHVFPLPGPGQLMTGLKGIFSTNGALKIRPGMNVERWKWLLKFATRCNAKDAMHAGDARNELLQSSRRLYDSLINQQSLEVEFKTAGLLFVFREQASFDHFAGIDRKLRTQFDVCAEALDSSALQSLEPALKPGLAGAFHYKSDAHLRPDRLMSELRRLLKANGVKIIENQRIKEIAGNGTASVVKSETDEFAADEFVIATGAWAPEMNVQLGCRIPIQPGKGYSITMPRPKLCPRFPMLLEEAHVGITPFDTGYRIGSTMELAGYTANIDPKRLEYLIQGATEYLKEPTAQPIQEQWYGWRPMTWDGLPYLDRSPKFANVMLATGHNMLGISMGTATGKLVAEMMTEQRPHIDPAPFRIGR